MAWEPTRKEMSAVLALEGGQRYTYCVKRIGDQCVLWSLRRENGWVLAEDGNGQQVVPVWPHEKYAERCAVGEWAGCFPSPIEIEAWLTRWTPGMKRDGRAVAVFPNTKDRGVVVTPDRFEADLRTELDKYDWHDD